MLNCSMKSYWVYILASRPRGTLYVGITNDLVRRVYEHREGLADGFTKGHRVTMVVYYEQHATAIAAIQREKNIKHWSRKWKIDLVLSQNPNWRDLWGRDNSLTASRGVCRRSAWTTGSSPVVTR
jgi:putative endonuclease